MKKNNKIKSRVLIQNKNLLCSYFRRLPPKVGGRSTRTQFRSKLSMKTPGQC